MRLNCAFVAVFVPLPGGRRGNGGGRTRSRECELWQWDAGMRMYAAAAPDERTWNFGRRRPRKSPFLKQKTRENHHSLKNKKPAAHPHTPMGARRRPLARPPLISRCAHRDAGESPKLRMLQDASRLDFYFGVSCVLGVLS